VLEKGGCLYGVLTALVRLAILPNQNMMISEQQRMQREFRRVCNTRKVPKDSFMAGTLRA
jgi:hypothetical protein